MTLELLDAQGRPVSRLQNHDSIRTWFGLVFIPMMSHTLARQGDAATLQCAEHGRQDKYPCEHGSAFRGGR